MNEYSPVKIGADADESGIRFVDTIQRLHEEGKPAANPGAAAELREQGAGLQAEVLELRQRNLEQATALAGAEGATDLAQAQAAEVAGKSNS